MSPPGDGHLAGFQAQAQCLGSSGPVPSGQRLHMVIKGLVLLSLAQRSASQDPSGCQHVGALFWGWR